MAPQIEESVLDRIGRGNLKAEERDKPFAILVSKEGLDASQALQGILIAFAFPQLREPVYRYRPNAASLDSLANRAPCRRGNAE